MTIKSVDIINQIFTFNEEVIRIGSPDLSMLTEKQHEWQQKFAVEELVELREAFDAQDIVKMVDAIGDQIYGAMGAFKKMGLTRLQTAACFTAIHRANMTKKRGDKGRGTDEDATKPADFVPPEAVIGQILFGWTEQEIINYIGDGQ